MIRREGPEEAMVGIIDMSDIDAELAERAANIERKQARSDFQSAEFACYFVDARIKPGGDMEIKLGIDPDQKSAALPLTDSAGLMLTIRAERRSR